MAPKSIWRGANAQHFTLVHRSQQDPLLNDAEASNRVLKATPKRHEAAAAASTSSSANGQSRRELERALGAIATKERGNVGEAANYGILFDDTEYDYMQHLRPIGGNDNSRRGGKDEAEEEEEVIMLEAPKAHRRKEKAAQSSGGELTFKDAGGVHLPQEVLPSDEMIPRTFEQDKQTGIRPDMDPHLRQVLEALEDDAFLMRTAGQEADGRVDKQEKAAPVDLGLDEAEGDEEDIDDFFDEIVEGGQLGADEEEPEWRNLPPGGEESIWLDPSARAARELLQLKEEGKGMEDLSLESRVALFKKAAEERQAENKASGRSAVAPSSVGSKSIFGEKGASRRSRHAGAKARLAASFYAPSIDGGATAFSMSSSAMERNQGLSTLDEQFARMERIYEQGGDDDDDEEGLEDALNALAEAEDENAVGGPENVDAIFDDFLSRNEVIGKRMRERLGGREMTSVEKVDLIRAELGQMRMIDRQTVDEAQADGRGPSVSVEELISRDLAERRNVRNAWDVETIQSTRTNVENHPRTIAAATSVAPSRISRIVPDALDGDRASMTSGTDRMARVKIDPRTGMSKVAGYIQIGARQARRQGQKEEADIERQPSALSDSSHDDDDDDDEYASDDTTTEDNVLRSTTVKRDRNESKEEKKARKQAVKEEKQARKAQKSMRKQQFKAALHTTNASSAAAIALQ